MDIIPASFARRLGALFYDLLLVLSFVSVLGFISMSLMMQIFDINTIIPGSILSKLFIVYLCFLCFIFFAWFWTHGGQTLGMQAWKIQIVSMTDKEITWIQAFIRFIFAWIAALPLRLGYFWMIFDKEKMTLHDYASKTRLIYKK